MATKFLEDKENLFAYHTIHDFFDTYILKDALEFLQTILKAAGTKKVWDRAFPFSLLYYMQQLHKLSSAAFTIHTNYARRAEAVIDKTTGKGHPGIELLQSCVGSKRGDNIWSCFPRHLSPCQFYDPYRAIKKFCHYMPEPAWKKALAELQEYALAPRPVSELYPPYNLSNIHRHLACLIEACHLLEVRTNNPIIKAGENIEAGAAASGRE